MTADSPFGLISRQGPEQLPQDDCKGRQDPATKENPKVGLSVEGLGFRGPKLGCMVSGLGVLH